MAQIEGQITIARDVSAVFDFVADERNEPRYNPRLKRVELLSPEPIGAGTRYRAETTSGRRTVPMTIEVTDYERPRRLGSRTHLAAMDITGVLTFDAVPGGTRMRWAWTVEPHGLLRVAKPIVIRFGRRQERAIWRSLKRFLEAGRDAARTEPLTS